METIVKEVAKYYNVYWKTLFLVGRGRREITLCRNMSILFIFHFFPEMTTTKVGDYFNRHHTTIVHSRKTLMCEMNIYKDIAKDYETLLSKLSSINLNKECTPVTVDDAFIRLIKMKTKKE